MSDEVQHEHRWYAGDADSDTIWWYCNVAGCTDQMTTSPALTPDRLREAAATLEAFRESTGREYDPDLLREEADSRWHGNTTASEHPVTFPCVVDDCPHEFVAINDLNKHSRAAHRQSWTGVDGVPRTRYPGADRAGDFCWHELT